MSLPFFTLSNERLMCSHKNGGGNMLTLCIMSLLVLILFAALLIMTGLVVIWPVTLALGIMIFCDIMLIRSIIRRD